MEFERHRYGSSSSSSSSSSSASPEQRPRHSIGISCCFSTSGGGGESPALSPSPSPSLLRSSSTWLRARAQELPDIVGRWGRRRRFASGDFRYDPLSYALNFDEGGGIGDDDGANVGSGFGSRYYSSRLPAPPPLPEIAVGVA